MAAEALTLASIWSSAARYALASNSGISEMLKRICVKSPGAALEEAEALLRLDLFTLIRLEDRVFTGLLT